MSSPTKFVLDESKMPTHWYNIAADLPRPLPPVLHPATQQPVGPDDLAPLFPTALIMQEVSTERAIEIPGPVRDVYRQWRPTPLYRARRLERPLPSAAQCRLRLWRTTLLLGTALASGETRRARFYLARAWNADEKHARKLRAAGELPATYPKIDFHEPVLRRGFILVAIFTFLNVVILGTASYRGVEHMDSVQFCGQTCHSVMFCMPAAFATSKRARKRSGCCMSMAMWPSK